MPNKQLIPDESPSRNNVIFFQKLKVFEKKTMQKKKIKPKFNMNIFFLTFIFIFFSDIIFC